MIPIRDASYSRNTPIITWTLIALNVIVYLWDRGGNLLGPSLVLGDLALRPNLISGAMMGQADSTTLVTLFTAMFLHANLAHILGNMVFLLAFGDNLEVVLGPVRFTLYYILWGILAFLTQVYVFPGSPTPVVGASGAIGGVLGAYFLLFPGNRIRFFIFPAFFVTFTVAAWVLLGLWFVVQLIPQEGVATWAHVGGFLAGMLTVLAMGGREKAVAGVKFEEEPDEED